MSRYRLWTALIVLTLLPLGVAAADTNQEAAPPAAEPGVAVEVPTGWVPLGDRDHSGKVPAAFNLPLALQWRVDTGMAGAVVATPAADRDHLYFVAPTAGAAMPTALPGTGGMTASAWGGQAFTLYALDRLTGGQRWRLDTGTVVTSALLVHNDTLYFGADDGRLWAVDTATGERRWRFQAEAAIRSAPLIVDNRLYFGSDDKRVYAYDLTTDEALWQFETGGRVLGTPLAWQDLLLFVSQDRYLYALRRADGSQVWRQPVASAQVFGSPMVQRGKAIVATGSHVVALDARLGSRRWSFATGDLVTATPAAGRYVYAGSRDGVLYAIDDLTGRAAWRYPERTSGPPILSSPIIVGDMVIVRRGDRLITALGQQDGRLRWQYLLPAVPYWAATPTGALTTGVGGAGAMTGMGGMPGATGMPGTTGATGLINLLDVVRSGVIAHGQDLFVVGNDGAAYGFSALAADALAPRLDNATLQLQIQGQSLAFRLRSAPVQDLVPPPAAGDVLQIPGIPPLWLYAELNDVGSGFDPASVRVLVNDEPVAPEQQLYEPERGLVWWIFNPPGLAALSLPGGMYCVTVLAADWAGNESQTEVYFYVDNALTMPQLPGQYTYPGMMPGMPGGMPGMPGGW